MGGGVIQAPVERESRGCLPTLAIALLMVAIVGGGFFAAGALSGRPPVPVEVGDGLTIAPPIQWQFVARIDPPAGGSDGVLLTRGVGSLLVFTSPTAAAEQLGQLRDELAGGPLMSVGTIGPAQTGRTEAALRFAFTGAMPELSAAPIEGEATAVQGAGSTAIFLAWADIGEYQLLRGEVEAMIRQAGIR